MKKLYRRSISGLMALLICFTTILGGGITAFAASSSGEVAKSYSIGFPRSGDANLDYSGTWGHDELHYMNGWTSGEATWMTTLHTIGSFDGPACYCIEPGVPRLLEKTYTRYGEDYWKNYPSDYNSTIDADTIRTLLGRIIPMQKVLLLRRKSCPLERGTLLSRYRLPMAMFSMKRPCTSMSRRIIPQKKAGLR